MAVTRSRIKKNVSFSEFDSFSSVTGITGKTASASASYNESLISEFDEDPIIVKDNEWTQDNSNPNGLLFPKFNASLIAVPFHLPVIAYSLFTVFGITVNPVDAMYRSLITLIISQSTYLILVKQLVIQPYNNSIKKSKKKASSSLSSTIKQPVSLIPSSGELIYMILSLVLSLLTSPLIYVVFVLYGAPISNLRKETFFLSVYISVLTVYPALICYPVVSNGSTASTSLMSSEMIWYRILTFQVGGREFYKHQIYTMIVGTFIGAWLGVMPIPLDWDRDWQAWPITILVGALLGNFVSSVLSLLANLVF